MPEPLSEIRTGPKQTPEGKERALEDLEAKLNRLIRRYNDLEERLEALEEE